MLDSGPKLDWTRDNQMFLCYKKWRSKIELIFRSALSTATPEGEDCLPQVLDG